jgi:hypothetical protein
MTSARARELAQQLVARADVLLSDEGVLPGRRPAGGLGPGGWLTHPAVAVFFSVILVASVTEALIAAFSNLSPVPAGFGLVLLRIVVVWMLAFTPGWIFVRFLYERVPSIWDTYVVDLYRLGWDRPEYLPRPPVASPFFERWRAAGGQSRLQYPNIYRQKFDAYYGASSSATGLDRQHRVRAEALLPVLLLTAVLSVCWTALLWNLRSLDLGPGAVKPWTCPAFGFLGAYTFGLNMLVRRFLQNDLRAGAYASFLLRILLVLLLAAGMHPLLDQLGAGAATQAAVMFVVGVFPPGLVRTVQRLAASSLRIAVPSLGPDYPLSDLEGMTTWHESLLQEEGIEDLQGLLTANLVDVLLHTQIPMARLVDWIDQACLLVHLDRSKQGPASKLRQLGIRTATDLLAVFPPEEMEPKSEPAVSTKAKLDAAAHSGVDAATVINLVHAVATESALAKVRSWKSDGHVDPPTTASA